MHVSKLLDRARLKLAKLGRRDPWEDAPPVEDAARELVAALIDEARGENQTTPLSHGFRFLKPSLDPALYARAIVDLAEDAQAKGAAAALASIADSAEWSCSCRCREHGAAACRACLSVERCPVHHEPPPNIGVRAKLSDPAYVAEAMAAVEADQLGVIITWDERPVHERFARIEAARQIVAALAPRMTGDRP